MSLTKQAKILTKEQQRAVLMYVRGGSNPLRDEVMFRLSVDAGLRAKEIADLDWSMITDAEGSLTDAIRLPDSASKGRSGGVVYLSKMLREVLRPLGDQQLYRGPVILSRSGGAMSAQVVTNWFWKLYKRLGFEGCSSHSGRRTAITRWAREISRYGGSMRDVQDLARHASLQMTQRYVEVNQDAKRLVVG